MLLPTIQGPLLTHAVLLVSGYVGLQSSNTYLNGKADKIVSPSYYKRLQVHFKTPTNLN